MNWLRRRSWPLLLLLGAGAYAILHDSQVVSRLILDYRHPSLTTQPFLQAHAHDYTSSNPLWRLSFFAHAFVGISVLASGILGFLTLLSRRLKRLHRYTGQVYVLSVIGVAAPTGMIMSLSASGIGWITRPNFFVLSLIWFLVTLSGRSLAKQGRFREHGAMMMLSFGLTLAALLQRRLAHFLNEFTYLFDLPTLPYAYEISAVSGWTVMLGLSLILVYRVLHLSPRELIRAAIDSSSIWSRATHIASAGLAAIRLTRPSAPA